MPNYLKYLMLALCFVSCAGGPQPIEVGKDQCKFCKMTIMEENFATEAITAKGKVFTYDDLQCMMKHANVQKQEGVKMYGANYYSGKEFLDLSTAILVKSAALKSPMAGNVATVSSAADAQKLIAEKGGEIVQLDNAFSK